jgi:hypothetical protein
MTEMLSGGVEKLRETLGLMFDKKVLDEQK